MGSDDPAWGPQLLGVPRPPAPQYGPAWGHGFAGDTRKIAGEYPTQGPKPTTPLAGDIPRQCWGPHSSLPPSLATTTCLGTTEYLLNKYGLAVPQT